MDRTKNWPEGIMKPQSTKSEVGIVYDRNQVSVSGPKPKSNFVIGVAVKTFFFKTETFFC